MMHAQRQYLLSDYLRCGIATIVMTFGATLTLAQDASQHLDREHMALLAAKLPPASVQWLKAGDDDFLGVYEAAYTGTPQGAILMLHAEGQHPAKPSIMEAIRQQLPQYGWATLSTVLPNPKTPLTPPRPPDSALQTTEAPTASENDTAETAAPGEDNEIFDETTGNVTTGEVVDSKDPQLTQPETMPKSVTKPVEERVTDRLKAALQFLHNQGIFNIVLLGHGTGATRAAEFYRTTAIDKTTTTGTNTASIRALLLVNARNRLPLADIDLPRSLTDPKFPVLDIYDGSSPRNQQEAQQRQHQAKRQRLSHFVQLRLPKQADMQQQRQHSLIRRVRGFLEKYAAGMAANK